MYLFERQKYALYIQSLRAFIEACEYTVQWCCIEKHDPQSPMVQILRHNIQLRDGLVDALRGLMEFAGYTNPYAGIEDADREAHQKEHAARERQLLDEIDGLRTALSVAERDRDMARKEFNQAAEKVLAMLASIMNVTVTHAQREGQLILLEKELRTLTWMVGTEGSDLPF